MLFPQNYAIQTRIFVTLTANSHDLRPLRYNISFALLCAYNHAYHRELFALMLSRHCFYLFKKSSTLRELFLRNKNKKRVEIRNLHITSKENVYSLAVGAGSERVCLSSRKIYYDIYTSRAIKETEICTGAN